MNNASCRPKPGVFLARKRVLLSILSKPNFDEYALEYFLLNLNRLQSLYEFAFAEFEEDPWIFHPNQSYDLDSLLDLFSKQVKPKQSMLEKPTFWINIITSEINGDLFCITNDLNTGFVTTRQLDDFFSPPSIFEYIVHAILASLLQMDQQFGITSHPEIRGCLMDYTYVKENDRVDIGLGYLCDECKSTIDTKANKQIREELENLASRRWIGNATEFGSVAYNLRHFYRFDINRDSGFNKTLWERARESFSKASYQILLAAVLAFITLLVGRYGPQLFG